MDQALKSLMASEEEVVTSGPFWAMAPSLSSPPSPSQAVLCHLLGSGRAWSFQALSAVTLTTLLFSSLLHPSPTVPSPLSPPTVSSHLTLLHNPLQ